MFIYSLPAAQHRQQVHAGTQSPSCPSEPPTHPPPALLPWSSHIPRRGVSIAHLLRDFVPWDSLSEVFLQQLLRTCPTQESCPHLGSRELLARPSAPAPHHKARPGSEGICRRPFSPLKTNKDQGFRKLPWKTLFIMPLTSKQVLFEKSPSSEGKTISG